MNFDKYKNEKPYPIYVQRVPNIEYLNNLVYSWAELIGEEKVNEIVSTIQNLIKILKDVELEAFAKRGEMLDAHGKEDKRLNEEFWKDAFAELGIDSNHPKAGTLKRIAWENGHAHGYSDVFSELINLADLLI